MKTMKIGFFAGRIERGDNWVIVCYKPTWGTAKNRERIFKGVGKGGPGEGHYLWQYKNKCIFNKGKIMLCVSCSCTWPPCLAWNTWQFPLWFRKQYTRPVEGPSRVSNRDKGVAGREGRESIFLTRGHWFAHQAYRWFFLLIWPSK